MAGLTKDELKSALVNHGVELDLTSIKKGELVDLYDQYVAPNDLNAGEFSSDDELGSPVKLKKKTSRSSRISEKSAKSGKELTEENSFVVGEVKIKELNDEELIEYLTKYGIDVGPIVDSTRSLYQKKLAIVMREQAQDGVDGEETNGHNGVNGTNGNLDKSLEEFSADDEVPEEQEIVVKKSSRKSATPKAPAAKSTLQALGTTLRQRFDKNRSENDRFTPTPRRSIHTYTVTETTKQTMTKSKDGLVTQDLSYEKTTSESKGETGAQKMTLFLRKVLPGILMVLILLALAYYITTSKKRS